GLRPAHAGRRAGESSGAPRPGGRGKWRGFLIGKEAVSLPALNSAGRSLGGIVETVEERVVLLGFLRQLERESGGARRLRFGGSSDDAALQKNRAPAGQAHRQGEGGPEARKLGRADEHSAAGDVERDSGA